MIYEQKNINQQSRRYYFLLIDYFTNDLDKITNNILAKFVYVKKTIKNLIKVI